MALSLLNEPIRMKNKSSDDGAMKSHALFLINNFIIFGLLPNLFCILESIYNICLYVKYIPAGHYRMYGTVVCIFISLMVVSGRYVDRIIGLYSPSPSSWLTRSLVRIPIVRIYIKFLYIYILMIIYTFRSISQLRNRSEKRVPRH